jgi:import receptor subunit TOM70
LTSYSGELLLDQQKFQEAVGHFDRAIELERLKKPPNVLPLVNKGLALFQWKQDIEAAERCCNEALRTDPECEAAVATLAQLSLQQGKINVAVSMFERHTELARNEPELINALTYQYASYAQLDFIERYPDLANELSQMARSMM